MNDTQVLEIAREAIWTGTLVAGPILITVLLVGVVVGIFQAATSINEMTVSFLPKLIAVTLIMMLLGSWQLEILMDFARRILERIPDVAG